VNYLLDTNALLFWLEGSRRMTRLVQNELVDPTNRVFVSSVSAFEIAVKASLKRLILADTPARLLTPFFAASGLRPLQLTMQHSFGVFDLPPHHSDPFDRLLVSQALHEEMTLVTSDRALAAYPVKVLLVR